MNDQILKTKRELVEIGKLLWDKNLATGFNGNLSARVDDQTIVLTGRGTCLGYLNEQNVFALKLDGTILEDGQVSSEKLLHTEIYKNFPDIKAIVHTHPTYTNGFFAVQKTFTPGTFEAKLYLGEVRCVEQKSPSVTDAAPVVEALKKNSIVVLSQHGTVAMAKNLFDAFVLTQCLEESIKADAVSRLYSSKTLKDSSSAETSCAASQKKAYKLFSKEQIEEIVRLVNADDQLKELGAKTQMTMDLAVKLDETGEVYSFHFQNGAITRVGKEENAEFLINAPAAIWKAVFNQEIDPFVATTQKKMGLRGDFAKISKWYAPCSRLFELWEKVPVE